MITKTTDLRWLLQPQCRGEPRVLQQYIICTHGTSGKSGWVDVPEVTEAEAAAKEEPEECKDDNS